MTKSNTDPDLIGTDTWERLKEKVEKWDKLTALQKQYTPYPVSSLQEQMISTLSQGKKEKGKEVK